jgi:hypothetical protein
MTTTQQNDYFVPSMLERDPFACFSMGYSISSRNLAILIGKRSSSWALHHVTLRFRDSHVDIREHFAPSWSYVMHYSPVWARDSHLMLEAGWSVLLDFTGVYCKQQLPTL